MDSTLKSKVQSLCLASTWFLEIVLGAPSLESCSECCCEAESNLRGTLQSVPAISPITKTEEETEAIEKELKHLKIKTETPEGAS